MNKEVSKAYFQLSAFEKMLFETWIQHIEFARMGNKTTVCLIRADSGFEIIGVSACLDVSKFDAAIGNEYALKDALRQLDGYVAFHTQETGIPVVE